MIWLHYIFCFFAGAFLANAVPHFVQGVSGNRFPTPFAKPPGRGLSSPLVNVVWALVNLVIAHIFFHLGRVWTGDSPGRMICFAAFAVLSIILSVSFQKKQVG